MVDFNVVSFGIEKSLWGFVFQHDLKLTSLVQLARLEIRISGTRERSHFLGTCETFCNVD